MKKTLLITVATLALAVASGHAADAKGLFESKCAKCHGADGKGETKMGKKLGIKDYSDAKVQAALTDAAVVKAIKEGKKDGEKVLMKPAEDVSDDDVKALATYVRSLKK